MTTPKSTDPPAPAPATALRRTVAVFSRGVARIPNLAELCGADRLLFRPSDALASKVDAVILWGQKPSGREGLGYALRHGRPVWRMEDGFLRSVGLGVHGEPPLSAVLDDCGIYYDARKPSRLEHWLNGTRAEDLGEDPGEDPLEDPALLARARAAMAAIQTHGLSKYNHVPPRSVKLEPTDRPRVLVVDQTAGDLSVRCGLASHETFRRMLEAAQHENPDAEIIVKTHPDVLAGKKRGYLEHVAGSRTRLFATAMEPFDLLGQVSRVYAVTSQLGFEALLAGVPVSCFGVPWYAGWGATDDQQNIDRRTRTRTVEQLFAAAYLLYARYLDPDSGEPGTLEQVIEHLALQREQFAKNQGRLYCFGFRFWKRGYMQDYLRCPGNVVKFCSRASDVQPGEGARVLVWGQREKAEVEAAALRVASSASAASICRVEDGFLRSVGLGSDLAMPASLVFDESGIYYDPTGPSDLETILEASEFSPAELTRADALRTRIVDAGLSKYNVGREEILPLPPECAAGNRTVVLVPGQVEDDASIQLGCRDIRTNLDLLRAAREREPEAFIIFKPHPDVLSGNRRGAVDSALAQESADHVEVRATLAACLSAADVVHTMTSLVGFEALLRNIRVVVYGQPFYSGWGLTEDRHPVARRTRRLTLSALVFGTLIRYPRYLDRETGAFTTPEATIDKLLAEREASGGRNVQMSWLRRQIRKGSHIFRGLRHAR